MQSQIAFWVSEGMWFLVYVHNAKESVRICAKEWIDSEATTCLLVEQGSGETHVTQIQENDL